MQCYSWRMLKKALHPTPPHTPGPVAGPPPNQHSKLGHLGDAVSTPTPKPTTGYPLREPPGQCGAAHASSQPPARCDGTCVTGSASQHKRPCFSNSRGNPGGQLPRNPATPSEMRTCALTSQEATHLLSQVITSTRREEHDIT